MDKNKDGVVTLEEFVLACQEVGIALYLSCPLLKIAAFMRLLHQIHATTLLNWTSQSSGVWCHYSLLQRLPSSLCRMKPWWDPCSCLKTWCRTMEEPGEEGGGQRQWKMRGLGDGACMWVLHRCNRSGLSSSFPVSSSCGSDAAGMPHNDFKQWSGELSNKATDVTDVDVTSLPILSGDKDAWLLPIS